MPEPDSVRHRPATDGAARPDGVTIIVPIKNGQQYIQESLPLLLNQNALWDLELIVIDSGSTDGTREFVEEVAKTDPRVRILPIEPRDFHHARTRNLGASMASRRYIVFLNGDSVPEGHDWLNELVGPVARGGEAGPVASYGRQVARPDADVLSICRMAYNYGPTPVIKDANSSISARRLYAFSTVACAIDSTRAPRPLFDDRFTVAEDIGLSKQIIDGGGSIAYVPRASVRHHHRYGYLGILRRYFDYGVIYQRTAIFDAGTRVRGDGWEYLRIAGQVLRRRPFTDTIRFAVFFVASAVGLQLGRWHRRLPGRLCRALTIYGTCGVTGPRAGQP